MRKITTDEFIAKAKLIHGDKYYFMYSTIGKSFL